MRSVAQPVATGGPPVEGRRQAARLSLRRGHGMDSQSLNPPPRIGDPAWVRVVLGTWVAYFHLRPGREPMKMMSDAWQLVKDSGTTWMDAKAQTLGASLAY